MNYSKKICTTSFLLLLSASTLASSWNFISIGNFDKYLYFFDADTVDKSSGSNINIWVKSVAIKTPSNGEAWSTAVRWKINCAKRSTQIIACSEYGHDGKFLKSGSATGQENEVVPNSMGEEMLKIIYEPNFPNDKSEKNYSEIKTNGIFQATKNYIDAKNSEIDNAPK